MQSSISEQELCSLILKCYDGLICKDVYRETTFFYNPDGLLPSGIYVCTIKCEDGPNDKASDLNRPGVYRLSCGLPPDKYYDLFGAKPKRPVKGQIVNLEIDFTVLDQIIPHPVYAWMGWVCVNSPGKETLSRFLKLMDCSYEKAKYTYIKKIMNICKEK